MNIKSLLIALLLIILPGALMGAQKQVKHLNTEDTVTHLEKTIEWLPRMSADEKQAIAESVEWKIEQIKYKVTELKDVLKGLSEKDVDEILAKIKTRIDALREQAKSWTEQEREEWKKEAQENLHAIKNSVKELGKKLKKEHPEELKQLRKKLDDAIEYLKKMPLQDKEAVKYMLQKKLDALKIKIEVLKDKNKKAFNDLKKKIEAMKKDKGLGLTIKGKLQDLYQEAHDKVSDLLAPKKDVKAVQE